MLLSLLRFPLTLSRGLIRIRYARRDELLLAFLKSTLARSGVEPSQVQDVVMGNVLDVAAPYVLRAAMLTAGFPDSTTVETVNRFCSSGLMAVSTISNRIRCGEIEVGLAVGFESMSAW
jgi:acetyl-CoA acetyltransferase